MAAKKRKKVDLAERKDLKEKMDSIIASMRENAADKDKFDEQADALLSLKGQLDAEPMRVFVPEKDVKKEAKGRNFYVAVTDKCAVYHAYGGYTLISDNRHEGSLYPALCEMADIINDPDADETSKLDTVVKSQIITAPMWCFGDVDATYDIASVVVSSQDTMFRKLVSQPLKEEDFKANAEFEDAVRGMEELKELIDEDKEKNQEP